jgi:hypothetical protein
MMMGSKLIQFAASTEAGIFFDQVPSGISHGFDA